MDLASDRYIIGLNFKNEANRLSELKVQTLDKEGTPQGIRTLNSNQYRQAVETVRNLLTALAVINPISY